MLDEVEMFGLLYSLSLGIVRLGKDFKIKDLDLPRSANPK